MISTPNQPILFGQAADACACGNDTYAQLVDFQDNVFFQVQLNCTSDPFYALRDNLDVWVSEGGFICNDGTSGGSYSFEVEPDDFYNVFAFGISVTEMNAGTLFVLFQGGQQYEITSAGDYTFYFNSDIMLTDLKPTVTLSGDSFDGCFLADEPLGLSVRGVRSDYRFFVIDENDDVVIDNADYVQANENFLTIGFNFDDHEIEMGCYRFAYSDTCDNVCGQFRITNQYFTYDGGWSMVAGASIDASSNNMEFVQTGSTNPRATNATLLCENTEYYVEFEILSITAGAINCYVGDSALVTGSTVGVHSGTITSTSGTEFDIRFNSTGGNEAVVSYVKVRYADDTTPVISGTSNTIQVGDYSDCKFVKVEGCNGLDSFGFKFYGSGFLPGIRMEHRFFRAQYVNEVESYQDANGNRTITFADSSKVKTLRVEQQPEYVFDFLRLVILFDILYVNGVKYFPNDGSNFSPQWNDGNELGSIDIELVPKTEYLRKVQCIETDASCLPSVFGGDDENLLLENGDRLLLQNGDDLRLQG